MDVHLRNLRYFVTVAEELHFSRAAERLRLSQPALSKQIRQLERELRFPLFRRERRRVELTAAGEALLPAARQLLADWERAFAAATQRANEEAKLLQVGFQTSVGGGLYQDIAARFVGRDPSGGSSFVRTSGRTRPAVSATGVPTSRSSGSPPAPRT
jgi:DNA-binding transcriptional LysR family regulator